MARKQSAILTAAEKRAVVKEQKAGVREAKADAAGFKKRLASIQKDFAIDPLNGDVVKDFRAAFSDYIRAAKAAAKLENKLAV